MTPHPKFNDESSCENCAAYSPDQDGKPFHGGECHRHAPRPGFLSVTHYPDESQVGDDRTLSETNSGVVWPRIEDVFFCCEWLPKVPAPETNKDKETDQ